MIKKIKQIIDNFILYGLGCRHSWRMVGEWINSDYLPNLGFWTYGYKMRMWQCSKCGICYESCVGAETIEEYEKRTKTRPTQEALNEE